MTGTARQKTPRPARTDRAQRAAVIGADIRRGEWGTPRPADMVSEYVFDIATRSEEPPADIGEALRVAIDEVLGAAAHEEGSALRSLYPWSLLPVISVPPIGSRFGGTGRRLLWRVRPSGLL